MGFGFSRNNGLFVREVEFHNFPEGSTIYRGAIGNTNPFLQTAGAK